MPGIKCIRQVFDNWLTWMFPALGHRLNFSPRTTPSNYFPALGTVGCFPRLDIGWILCPHITQANFFSRAWQALGTDWMFSALGTSLLFSCALQLRIVFRRMAPVRSFPALETPACFVLDTGGIFGTNVFFLRWALRHFYWVWHLTCISITYFTTFFF